MSIHAVRRSRAGVFFPSERGGRVVVLAEAGVFTARIVTAGDQMRRLGLTWPGTDDRQFVLHWLSRVIR